MIITRTITITTSMMIMTIMNKALQEILEKLGV